ncbi:hypothetical protein L5515_004330 [Caenorhabditis briggsae]|uniref:Glycosyltransferase family 92 protein n=2 Tax=Caenorhabditis briggsae TaxID=6238 RepID=A0AAE9DC75_CAEBR|nr:hypothetical protein L3Y34_001477 [Caenorhabditis briggsae]UMM23786.1 hypothetical protein L5515_004330 [Caenorhabditis briggsae]
MEPKSIFLLGLLMFRVGRLMRNEKLAWSAEYESKKFKSYHNTSLFLTLQSTGPELTRLCQKSWCEKVDDLFVIPQYYVNWQKPTEPWLIHHFSKMILHSRRLPHHAEWYMFAFDNNYFFVERLVKELSKFDSHLPIYTILRDSSTRIPHKPVLILSRFAMNTFYDLQEENCSDDAESVEEWLTSCISIPPITFSIDKKKKSRIFAINRHFQVDEMKSMPIGYHDDKEYIHGHSKSLLSFTNLTIDDMKLLSVFVDKVHGGSRNRIKIEKTKNYL